jgi:hypothetical protein
VTKVYDIDIDLADLHSGFPVTVEREHSSYTSDLESKIESLGEGNVVSCELQSEDVLQTDGIWRFLDLDRVDNSNISFVQEAPLPEERAQQISYRIVTEGGAYEEYTLDGYGDLTVILIGSHFDEEKWKQLRYDPYREVYSWFTEDPPYEIIHQKIPDEGFKLSYHLSETGTQYAEDLKEGEV